MDCKIDGSKIVGKKIDKDTQGIIAYVTESGKDYSCLEAEVAHQEGRTENLVYSSNQYGTYLKARRNNDVTDNLDDLPVLN